MAELYQADCLQEEQIKYIENEFLQALNGIAIINRYQQS